MILKPNQRELILPLPVVLITTVFLAGDQKCRSLVKLHSDPATIG